MSASIASRVVPGAAVTMARSLPSSALKSEDFPTLGGPASTTSAPGPEPLAGRCRRQQPADLLLQLGQARGDPRRRHRSVVLLRESRCRSPAGPRRRAARPGARASRRESPPSRWWSAARAWAGAVASIRSPTASAWSRSIRPFSTARRVNSPGSAVRAPGRRGARRGAGPAPRARRDRRTRPGPRRCSCGGRGRRCRAPGRSASRQARRKSARCAVRGGLAVNAVDHLGRDAEGPGPDSRTTASAERPGGWRARRWGRRT